MTIKWEHLAVVHLYFANRVITFNISLHLPDLALWAEYLSSWLWVGLDIPELLGVIFQNLIKCPAKNLRTQQHAIKKINFRLFGAQ